MLTPPSAISIDFNDPAVAGALDVGLACLAAVMFLGVRWLRRRRTNRLTVSTRRSR